MQLVAYLKLNESVESKLSRHDSSEQQQKEQKKKQNKNDTTAKGGLALGKSSARRDTTQRCLASTLLRTTAKLVSSEP